MLLSIIFHLCGFIFLFTFSLHTHSSYKSNEQTMFAELVTEELNKEEIIDSVSNIISGKEELVLKKINPIEQKPRHISPVIKTKKSTSATEDKSKEETFNIKQEYGVTEDKVSVFQQASPVRAPHPKYPEIARRIKMEGRTLLDVLVDEEGHVKSVTIKESAGFAPLDEAAIKTVEMWHFAPAKEKGISVSSRVEVPIRFVLSEIQ